jgi:hypothetical protein
MLPRATEIQRAVTAELLKREKAIEVDASLTKFQIEVIFNPRRQKLKTVRCNEFHETEVDD